MKCISTEGKNHQETRIQHNTIGEKSYDFNMKIIFFEYYAMLYTGTTNTSNIGSIPIFSLRGSNEYGGHLLMLMYTRKNIHSNNWVELPIGNEIVKMVKELEKLGNNPPF